MRVRRILLPALLAAASLAPWAPPPAAAVASAWAVNGPSRVRLITPYRVAPATGGADLRLGLHFLLEPGWHVYWKNSGDAGYPPVIALSGSPVPVVGELLWPAPQRFELRGGLVAFGYEGEVVYPVRVRPGAGSGSPEQLNAELDYLVCQVDCIPFHSRLTLAEPRGAQPVADPETSPLIERGWSQLPLAAGTLPGVSAETTFGSGPGEKAALTVRLHGMTAATVATAAGTAGTAGADPRGTDLFIEPQDLFETGRPEVIREAGGILFRVPLTPKQVGKPLPSNFPFAWTATGLTPLQGGGRAVALADRITVALQPGAAARPGGIAKASNTSNASNAANAANAVGPVGIAGLAVLSTLLALGLWGLFSPGGEPARSPGRVVAGFLAALGTLAALYLLSRSVRTEGLAAVELALLGMALFAWLRRIAAGGSKLSWALWIALGLAAASALWLAAASRLG
jgi:DsbC/DsbD-like thiol-disulfide interchange protein